MTATWKPIIAVVHDWGSVASKVEDEGVIALAVSDFDELGQVMPHIDGLVFTGGGDVEPTRYGQERDPSVYGVDAQRDTLEIAAVKWARSKRIPMMGICRGLQVINVAYGGTLIQNVPDSPVSHEHDGVDHYINVRRKSRVGRALGVASLIGTSIHHQAIDRLGHGLMVAGWASDGIIELIESAPHERPYVMASQFHPEMARYGEEAKKLFEFFADHCRGRASNRADSFEERREATKNLVYWRGAKYYYGGYGGNHGMSGGWDEEGEGFFSGSEGSTRSMQEVLDDDEDIEYSDWWRMNQRAAQAVRKDVLATVEHHYAQQGIGLTHPDFQEGEDAESYIARQDQERSARICIMEEGCPKAAECVYFNECEASIHVLQQAAKDMELVQNLKRRGASPAMSSGHDGAFIVGRTNGLDYCNNLDCCPGAEKFMVRNLNPDDGGE